MAKKSIEKKQRTWYAISDSPTDSKELYLYDNIEQATLDGGWDFEGKRYAFKIELLGEVKQTLTIVK